jgi:proteasome lid subunit RPN8/RPN11
MLQQPRFTSIPTRNARRWIVPGEDAIAPAVQVFLSQRAFVRICAHAGSDLDNEVGGWLVGVWCWDKTSQEEFVLVQAIIPADHTRNGSAFLTFTHESQLEMLGILEARFPGKNLVGWFHTHPRMGVFLSGYDLFLHNHFFPHPWQVALVIEPHSAVGGFFIRDRDHRLDARHHYGFHEIHNGLERSVVHWRNLELAEEPLAAPLKKEKSP